MNNINQPLITIITPLYNAEKYIAKTIQSVINQTYIHWEMIIVDDCSTDASREIVKEYEKNDDRIILLEFSINFGGPARPRNKGLENANGKYMAFLDADDVWLPEKLQKQLNFIQTNNIDIVHTLANVIDENSIYQGFLNSHRIYNKLKYFFNERDVLFYTNFININSVLMKTNKQIKFSEDKNLIALEDWNYWIDNLCSGVTVKLLEERLLNYRVCTTSLSSRETDTSYRKGLYLLSFLLLNKKISTGHYMFSSFFWILKLIIKNSKLKLKGLI
ncbi:MAG: glycosyltransferase family 2 protein [Campylobacterales bacterium]|nr:glycosyltransferase family 2 protein [Campylobacterales bacterium]